MVERRKQLAAADAARIAAENGMKYRYLPVSMAMLSIETVRAFGDAVPDDGTLIHAHCGSGLRAAILWGLNQTVTGRLNREAARQRVSEAGFDLAPGLAWLDANGEGKAA